MSLWRSLELAGSDATEEDKIAGAVRAELARRSIPATELVNALELRSSAIYARINGDVAFSYTELRAISDHLGIPNDILIGDAVPDFYATTSPHSRRPKT